MEAFVILCAPQMNLYVEQAGVLQDQAPNKEPQATPKSGAAELKRYIAMKIIYIILTFFITINTAYSSGEEWRIKSIKTNYAVTVPFLMPTNTEIEFNGGHTIKTDIIEFELLNFIKSKSGAVFIIYTGRTCTECDMHTSIYVNAVSDKQYSSESRYGYPGKLMYYLDGSLIEESRMFYGECTKNEDPTIIWYTRYLGDDNKWHKAVYDIDFKGVKTIKNPNKISYATLSKTEELVKNGKCTEVEGQENSSEP